MDDSVFSEVVEAGTGCDGSGGGSGGGGEWCCSEWLHLSILNMPRDPLMPSLDTLLSCRPLIHVPSLPKVR